MRRASSRASAASELDWPVTPLRTRDASLRTPRKAYWLGPAAGVFAVGRGREGWGGREESSARNKQEQGGGKRGQQQKRGWAGQCGKTGMGQGARREAAIKLGSKGRSGRQANKKEEEDTKNKKKIFYYY